MSPLRTLLLYIAFALAASKRADVQKVISDMEELAADGIDVQENLVDSEELAHHDSAPPAAMDTTPQDEAWRTNSQILAWGETNQHDWGEYGVMMEYAVDQTGLIEKGQMGLLGQADNVEKIRFGIWQQLNELNGIAATVVTNACMCFVETTHEGKVKFVLPFTVILTGISDYEAFKREQLKVVAEGMFKQLREGEPGTEAEVVNEKGQTVYEPVKDLLQTLEENPKLSGCVAMSETRDLDDYNFLIQLELSKTCLITKVTKFTTIANIAEGIGVKAAKTANVLKEVYKNIAKEISTQAGGSGIDITVRNAVDAISNTGSPVIGEIDTKKLVDHKRGGPRTLNKDVVLWHRKLGAKVLLGLRIVITVVGTNSNFAKSKLPLLRNGVAEILPVVMPESINSEAAVLHLNMFNLNPRLSVQKCGWTHARSLVGPLPHDATPCHDPPSDARVYKLRQKKVAQIAAKTATVPANEYSKL